MKPLKFDVVTVELYACLEYWMKLKRDDEDKNQIIEPNLTAKDTRNTKHSKTKNPDLSNLKDIAKFFREHLKLGNTIIFESGLIEQGMEHISNGDAMIHKHSWKLL